MNVTEYEKRLKTGRNEPCPCGSGKKYKKCHLTEDEAAKHADFVKAAQEREDAAAESEGDGEKAGSKKSGTIHKNFHERSGRANKSKGGKQNIPRRGAV